MAAQTTGPPARWRRAFAGANQSHPDLDFRGKSLQTVSPIAASRMGNWLIIILSRRVPHTSVYRIKRVTVATINVSPGAMQSTWSPNNTAGCRRNGAVEGPRDSSEATTASPCAAGRGGELPMSAGKRHSQSPRERLLMSEYPNLPHRRRKQRDCDVLPDLRAPARARRVSSGI